VAVFDGKTTHRYDPRTRRFAAGPPDQFTSPKSYLGGLGLAAPDPTAGAAAAVWLPDSLDRYAAVEVLPDTEMIDGRPCAAVTRRKISDGAHTFGLTRAAD
jgi:hypothetical protein